MRIRDLLAPESIQLNGSATGKEDVLNQMVSLMVKSGKIADEETYRKGVFAREEESTTGIGEGIAIPHCKSAAVKKPGLSAMVLKNGVDFDALDGEKVHLIFLIAAPDTEDNVHLDVLSRLSVLLMDENFTNGLKQAASVEEFLKVIDEAESEKEEKEEQKEVRARMREEAKLAKEIEEERKKLEKEQQHYQNALQRINAQLEAASDADRAAIEEKKAELVAQLDKIDKEFADVDYREANQRAGYVYVISNIGAFGENVYKIGMTRRLDPQDRVDELGDASVPFNFDVHAMIFSNDAPKLEAALHNAFADRKLNFVNQRREFFNVSLDEIKQVIKDNYDKSVEFVELAPAEQYRESLKLKEQMKKKCIK